MSHPGYGVTDFQWVRHLAFELFLAWKRVVELGARRGVCALRVQSSYFDLDKEDKIATEVAGWMAACAQHGLLIDRKIVDYLGVSECLEIARHLLPVMPDIAGALTKRLDEVADATRERAHAGDQEAKVILETLTNGLERIREEAVPYAAEFNGGYRGV